MPQGRVLTECPIATADGVPAADVAWASPEVLRELGHRACFPHLPELGVEVLSPADSAPEINENVALCFNAGERRVGLCDHDENARFLSSASGIPRWSPFRPLARGERRCVSCGGA
jgi:hypothetical protein